MSFVNLRIMLVEHFVALILGREPFLILRRNCLTFACRPKGSDCGIVNVNVPTSGAEIGGAFGMLLVLSSGLLFQGLISPFK